MICIKVIEGVKKMKTFSIIVKVRAETKSDVLERLEELENFQDNPIDDVDENSITEIDVEENLIPNEIKVNVYYSFLNNGKVLFDTDEMKEEFDSKMEAIISKYKNFKEKKK